MASEVDICNFALRRVGAERISALTDNNKRAKACNDAYSIARDALLRAHPWNFAIKRVSLAKLASVPEFGFANEFQLPADALRVLTLSADRVTATSVVLIPDERIAPGIDYRIEGDKLLTDDSTVKIEYLSNSITTADFDANFIEALGYKLAAELAYSLVQSNELSLRLEARLKEILRDARLYDAQEGSPRQLFKADWTNERL